MFFKRLNLFQQILTVVAVGILPPVMAVYVGEATTPALGNFAGILVLMFSLIGYLVYFLYREVLAVNYEFETDNRYLMVSGWWAPGRPLEPGLFVCIEGEYLFFTTLNANVLPVAGDLINGEIAILISLDTGKVYTLELYERQAPDLAPQPLSRQQSIHWATKNFGAFKSKYEVSSPFNDG